MNVVPEELGPEESVNWVKDRLDRPIDFVKLDGLTETVDKHPSKDTREESQTDKGIFCLVCVNDVTVNFNCKNFFVTLSVCIMDSDDFSKVRQKH